MRRQVIITLCSVFSVGCAVIEPPSKPGKLVATLETDEDLSRPGNTIKPPRAHTITYAETKACAQTSFLGRGTVNNRGAHLGQLSVHPGENGEPAKVDIVCFDFTGNGRSYAISVDELRKFPVIPGLNYGVSTDSKLLLIKEEGFDVWILRDRQGNYDSQDFRDFNKDPHTRLEDLFRMGYGLTPGRRTEDGRIVVIPARRSERSVDFRVYVEEILGALPGFRRGHAR